MPRCARRAPGSRPPSWWDGPWAGAASVAWGTGWGGAGRWPLTILTYAAFTGLAYTAQSWWQLLVFRFLSALGIGGEWAVGSSLLSETWPRRWRPWIAAVLQAGVNIGILLACLAVYLMAGLEPRYVFLVGVLPALMVFWIRRHVPEPAVWRAAQEDSSEGRSVGELFRPGLRGLTVKAIAVCSLSLTAWWAFMFWHAQHVRNLPEIAHWGRAERERLVTTVFFLIITASIAGCFFSGWLARVLGYRRAIASLTLAFFVSMAGAFIVPRGYLSLMSFWFPLVGFFSGVFGLYTMFLPPLFPTLLRTTGAGFSYNIGRIAAAFGTVLFGLFSQVGDFRLALLYASSLLLLAAPVALWLPDHPE